MAKFLTKAEVYSLLQREMPEGLYTEGDPAASYSNAELDSAASSISAMYSTAEIIYRNMFPSQVEEQIMEWETKVFGFTNTSGITLSERIGLVLSQMRSDTNLSTWDLLVGVAGVVQGVFVQIIQNHELYEFGTIDCRGPNADQIWGPDWTYGDTPPANCWVENYILESESELRDLRVRAFGYQVKVYSDTLTDVQKYEIEKFLTKNEAARSDHTIAYVATVLNTYVQANRFSRNIAIRIREDGTIQGASLAPVFGFDGDSSALGFGTVTDDTVGGDFYSLT